MVRKQIRGRRRPAPAGLRATLDMLADKFRKAVHAADETYARLGIPHVLIGGIAVGAYAEPRATQDVDFLVGDEAFETVGAIISFRAGVPLEAAGVPVDSVPIDPKFRYVYTEAIESAEESDEPGIKLVEPEYLAALKLISGRRRDLSDVVELVAHGLEEEAIHQVVGEFPQLVDRLNATMDEAES